MEKKYRYHFSKRLVNQTGRFVLVCVLITSLCGCSKGYSNANMPGLIQEESYPYFQESNETTNVFENGESEQPAFVSESQDNTEKRLEGKAGSVVPSLNEKTVAQSPKASDNETVPTNMVQSPSSTDSVANESPSESPSEKKDSEDSNESLVMVGEPIEDFRNPSPIEVPVDPNLGDSEDTGENRAIQLPILP